ncbi:MAG: GTPase ObgE [Erysipelotrichaceae bacterium]
MFIDKVKISATSGNGGNGIVSFRHEKYVPLGGPNGGDGGKGGDIVFVADNNKSTLLDLKYNRKIVAKNGENGKTKKMHGADALDIIVKVPVGTIVKDAISGDTIADFTYDQQSIIILKGGNGGRGNTKFANSRNSAPEFAEDGFPGETKELLIELKLLADVGLVGFPSVGKSTLLSVVSKAKPEIGDYPFTTIVPNLGVVQIEDRSFVMADLPGLIEGASQGKGLGQQFLRHIERCRVLVHIIDMGANDGRDPLEDYEIINNELKEYQYRLMERPQVVVANKMDLENAKENLERFKKKYPNLEVFETITIIDEGMKPLLYRIADLLEVTPAFPINEEDNTTGVVYRYHEKEKGFEVKALGNNEYMVSGIRVTNLMKQIDFDTEEGVMKFAYQMKKMGIDDELRSLGAKENDTIIVGDIEFSFVE